MFPDRIDHYRAQHDEGEIRPQPYIPLYTQLMDFDFQEKVVQEYYHDWRLREEFDMVGTGLKHYVPAPLSEIYKCFFNQWYKTLGSISNRLDEDRASELRTQGPPGLVSVLEVADALYLYRSGSRSPRFGAAPRMYREQDMLSFTPDTQLHRHDHYVEPAPHPVIQLMRNPQDHVTNAVMKVL